MNKDIDLLKHPEIVQRISQKGRRIYNKIKKQYDPKYRGRYLAIEVDSGDVFLAKTGVEAREKAHEKYPDKVVFLEKIGFDTAEAMYKSWFGHSAHGTR